MARYKVTCVTKKDDSNTGITHIGSGFGVNKNTWSKADAIRAINLGTTQFYTDVNGVEADVVVRGTFPDEYLTTDPDRTTKNNLLSLTDC
jgi:hypothetical protein